MKHTGQTQQPDFAARPGAALFQQGEQVSPAAGESSYEWQDHPVDEIKNGQTALFRVALGLTLDEQSEGPAGGSTTEPDSQSVEQPAGTPSTEDDLLIIPLRTADRRAGDFLTGWVRRFSRT